MTAHWCKSLTPFTLQLPILNLNMCVSWVIRQTLNVFLFKHCLHLSFTYSTALLYTSMALSVSPASRWTFPSIKKVLSCLFNCRAVFRCSSAWQRHNISFIKSVWTWFNLYRRFSTYNQQTHIFEVFDEEIAQSKIMGDLLMWEIVKLNKCLELDKCDNKCSYFIHQLCGITKVQVICV